MQACFGNAGSFGWLPWGVNSMERSSKCGPVVVEVWRDFDLWPADAQADADTAAQDAADAAAEEAAGAGEGPDVAVSGGVWESQLARVVSRWWLEWCPGWVSAQWADVRLSSPVRDLMGLPPGPALLAAVAAIAPGPCRVDHKGEELPGIEPVPGTVPGWACACQVVVAAAWEACASWTQVQSASALVATTGTEPVLWSAPPGCGGGVTDPIAEELAPALRLSPASTGNRIAAARRLAAIPAMTGLVAEGLLGAGPARLIADDLDVFPPEDVAAVTVEVAGRVRVRARSGLRAWTGTEIRQQVARALLKLGSAKVAKARRQARQGRRVTVTPDSHGMAWLGAYMSAVDAARIYARLTAIAKGIHDPDRGMDATRTDLLIDALLTSKPAATTDAEAEADAGTGPQSEDGSESGADADLGEGSEPGADVDPAARSGAGRAGAGSPAAVGRGATRRARAAQPRSGRRAPADICVVVNLTTLLGLDQDPGDIAGVGPIPAEEARELAADGRWRAWITDAATGQVIDTGRRSYTPSAALARLIRAREPYCRMPGCRRRAINCDLDHTVPWPKGSTTEANLGPLCRRHHRCKTHFGFGLQPNPGGPETGPLEANGTGGAETGCGQGTAGTGWTWTMPSGLTYRDTPDPPLDP